MHLLTILVNCRWIAYRWRLLISSLCCLRGGGWLYVWKIKNWTGTSHPSASSPPSTSRLLSFGITKYRPQRQLYRKLIFSSFYIGSSLFSLIKARLSSHLHMWLGVELTHTATAFTQMFNLRVSPKCKHLFQQQCWDPRCEWCFCYTSFSSSQQLISSLPVSYGCYCPTGHINQLHLNAAV